jgi:hypothetical protein
LKKKSAKIFSGSFPNLAGLDGLEDLVKNSDGDKPKSLLMKFTKAQVKRGALGVVIPDTLSKLKWQNRLHWVPFGKNVNFQRILRS